MQVPVLSAHGMYRGRKKGNMGLYVHRNHKGLLGTGKLGGQEFISNTYSLQYHHQNDSALRWTVSCVSNFNVSLIVWAKSQDSAHKPQFLKRRERRAEADRTKVLLLISLAPYR